ncbi:MAG: VanW family protein [Candidatus Curtissbacteria bacterium]|nr:VanW family protein [Candidatus Curtissbacteria bacterium]
MISNIVAIIATFSLFGHTITSPIPPLQKSEVLAEHQFSLENRYNNPYVNGVFKDNILLNVAYLAGEITSPGQINWSDIGKPFEYKFTLEPGKTFAYHDDVLTKYEGKVTKTTGAHFNAQEGFKSDGYLVGDGVCHLASLIYWAAKDAGLDAEALVNHNFAKINEVPKEFGVSIYSLPGAKEANAQQNLYITNNRQKPVKFVFDYKNNNLKVSVVEES